MHVISVETQLMGEDQKAPQKIIILKLHHIISLIILLRLKVFQPSLTALPPFLSSSSSASHNFGSS